MELLQNQTRVLVLNQMEQLVSGLMVKINADVNDGNANARSNRIHARDSNETSTWAEERRLRGRRIIEIIFRRDECTCSRECV